MITGNARNLQVIATGSAADTPGDWQVGLQTMIRTLDELRRVLDLQDPPPAALPERTPDFPVRTTRFFAGLMTPGDWHDPLLAQVLPWQSESDDTPGFTADPLAEDDATALPGLIHKYRSRVLLVPTGACAIHCRYCFRRHFPYSEHRMGRAEQRAILDYIAARPAIDEVIFSGGDPLMLTDQALKDWLQALSGIPSLRRVRLHTRLPVVLPDRLTPGLLDALTHTRLNPVLVLHANHPGEISSSLTNKLNAWRGRVTLLNQSVLLRGVNDRRRTLTRLSEELFGAGVIPYYLHQTDPVAGTAHFGVAEGEALRLHRAMKTDLPGYLVPRLVREIPGEPAKTWLGQE